MTTDTTRGAEPTGFFTVAEAAEELKYTEATVRRKVASGELAGVKLGPHPSSPIRIPRVSVQNYLTANIVEAR